MTYLRCVCRSAWHAASRRLQRGKLTSRADSRRSSAPRGQRRSATVSCSGTQRRQRSKGCGACYPANVLNNSALTSAGCEVMLLASGEAASRMQIAAAQADAQVRLETTRTAYQRQLQALHAQVIELEAACDAQRPTVAAPVCVTCPAVPARETTAAQAEQTASASPVPPTRTPRKAASAPRVRRKTPVRSRARAALSAGREASPRACGERPPNVRLLSAEEVEGAAVRRAQAALRSAAYAQPLTARALDTGHTSPAFGNHRGGHGHGDAEPIAVIPTTWNDTRNAGLGTAEAAWACDSTDARGMGADGVRQCGIGSLDAERSQSGSVASWGFDAPVCSVRACRPFRARASHVVECRADTSGNILLCTVHPSLLQHEQA